MGALPSQVFLQGHCPCTPLAFNDSLWGLTKLFASARDVRLAPVISTVFVVGLLLPLVAAGGSTVRRLRRGRYAVCGRPLRELPRER